MRASLRVAGLLGGLLLCPRPSLATPLGSLENEALHAALAARGLTLEDKPEGKTVGTIFVVNLEVFQPQDGEFLGFFNHFHRTTREHHIRRESLLSPGMGYDQARVDETVRNLRGRGPATDDMGFSSMVIMVPVRSPDPHGVDLLIVTRDLWSLRFNTDYDYNWGSLVALYTSLSENNFLGFRKRLSLVFNMDQGSVSIGPNYVDPNVLGTKVRLLAAFYGIWARRLDEIGLGDREGTTGRVRLEYPLYSLASRYGAFVDGSYSDGVARRFWGTSLATIRPTLDSDCQAPSISHAPNEIPCAYRYFSAGVTSGLVRSFPHPWIIQRTTFGHELGLRSTEFLPGFPEDPATREAFAAKVSGPNSRDSGIYLTYEAFTPRYRIYRNFSTFDLGEDSRIGPYLTLRIGRTAKSLGSDESYTSGSADLHWNGDLLDGFQNLGIGWSGRRYGGDWREQLVKMYARLATPILGRVLRLWADGSTGIQSDRHFRAPFMVGGKEGLRGYPMGAFSGDRGKPTSAYYIGHLEARSVPLALGFLRWGGAIFADAGHAASQVQKLSFYSSLGVGLRILIPQLNVDVMRVDWAFPVRTLVIRTDAGDRIYPAGWPGHFSLSFRQAF